jgi:Zn-dependent peptidase ImmA (M78 family)
MSGTGPRVWDQQSAAGEATKLIKKLGITEPPVPIEQIAESLNAIITRRPNAPDISGFLLCTDGNPPMIGVNEDDAPVRQRFTIAHEIAHLQLHELRNKKSDRRELRIDRSMRVSLREAGDGARGGEEREANWFAAELLMPAELVRRIAEELSQTRQATEDSLINNLADRFEVSRVAMSYRLLNLGLLRSY